MSDLLLSMAQMVALDRRWYQMDDDLKSTAFSLACDLADLAFKEKVLTELSLRRSKPPTSEDLESWRREVIDLRNRRMEEKSKNHEEYMKRQRATRSAPTTAFSRKDLHGNPVGDHYATEYGSVSNPIRRRVG